MQRSAHIALNLSIPVKAIRPSPRFADIESGRPVGGSRGLCIVNWRVHWQGRLQSICVCWPQGCQVQLRFYTSLAMPIYCSLISSVLELEVVGNGIGQQWETSSTDGCHGVWHLPRRQNQMATSLLSSLCSKHAAGLLKMSLDPSASGPCTPLRHQQTLPHSARRT